MRRGPGGGARCRRLVEPGRWEVQARIERFVEPALLMLLRERPMHGYELLELVPQVATQERRVDLGNLYRALRALEEEGVVTSEWAAGMPGPAKRTYALTDAGRRLLDDWARALGEAQVTIAAFLDRYENGKEVNG